jgi:uncharacterized membrane protein
MSETKKPTKEILKAWHNDPKNWKLGVIYFNKLDRRILVPKRISGMGWTTNFANPISILIIVGVIALIALVSKYLR